MYTIVFRKNNIELVLSTDDKQVIERQLAMIISQASNNSSQHKHETIQKEEVQTPPETFEQKDEHNEPPTVQTFDNIPLVTFEHISDSEKDRIIQIDKEQEDEIIVPQTLEVGSIKPITINSIQNPEPIVENAPNFDNILNAELDNNTNANPIIKDEKYIQYVESKSAIEKFDFLIITAQYLIQFENKNTFSLKHINAKLMQNFTIIVDHSVIQNAIARDYIIRTHDGIEDGGTEYILTEKGLRSY